MKTVNQVTLIGNLGADPDIRSFPSGGRVANLRVATSETIGRDRRTGERRERTEWHSVTILAKPLIDLAERYLRRGSAVYLRGRLETRRWQDKDGNTRFTTEIVLRPYSGELIVLDRRQRMSGAPLVSREHNDSRATSRSEQNGARERHTDDDAMPF